MLKRIELELFKGRAVCFSRFIQSGIFYTDSITETNLVHCMLKIIQLNIYMHHPRRLSDSVQEKTASIKLSKRR